MLLRARPEQQMLDGDTLRIARPCSRVAQRRGARDRRLGSRAARPRRGAGATRRQASREPRRGEGISRRAVSPRAVHEGGAHHRTGAAEGARQRHPPLQGSDRAGARNGRPRTRGSRPRIASARTTSRRTQRRTTIAGAKAAALRAVALDETDAEAHASLAIELAFHDLGLGRRRSRDPPVARTGSIRASLRRCSDHDGGRAARRSDDAVAEGRGPLSALGEAEIVGGDGIWLRRAPRRRHREGERAERPRDAIRRTDMPGDSAWLLSVLAHEHSMKGEHAKAIAAAEALVARDARPQSRVTLAFVYARAGRRAEARALAERLEAEARRSWRSMETRASARRPGRHPARARHGRQRRRRNAVLM